MKKAVVITLGTALFFGMAAATWAKTIVRKCTDAGQICSASASIGLPDDGDAIVEISAGDRHCAEVKYILKTQDGDFIGGTGWLAAGESDQVLVPSETSPRSIRLFAKGRKGGCNTGRLSSWSADVEVMLP